MFPSWEKRSSSAVQDLADTMMSVACYYLVEDASQKANDIGGSSAAERYLVVHIR
jgi:hypothetical protein